MLERVRKEYWDANWQSEATLPAAFDPAAGGVRGLFRRRFHAFFEEQLRPVAPPGASLIEIGCGRSQLLPYFAKAFGLCVAGLDYSEVGCMRARQILERDGVRGDVFCADLWEEGAADGRQYDVVFSFGLVEHFDDTPAILRTLARFARRGGAVLTLIPNMRGTVGLLQRALSRDIYDIHVPLTAQRLAEAHAAIGLSLRSHGYLLPAHFGVCNAGRSENASTTAYALRQLAYRGAIGLSTALLWLDEAIMRIPASRLMSPYAFACATNPAQVPSA